MPWITRMSSSASSTCFAYRSTRCGVSDAHDVTPASLISRMRGFDELVLDRLGVDLLHAARGLLDRQLRDLLEERLGILVARPEAFEVQAREAAEVADLDRDAGRHDAVHRRGDRPAARSGTRRAPTRCRRPRGRGCAGWGRSRCRRTRRPADRTCRCRSRLPPATSCKEKSLPPALGRPTPGAQHRPLDQRRPASGARGSRPGSAPSRPTRSRPRARRSASTGARRRGPSAPRGAPRRSSSSDRATSKTRSTSRGSGTSDRGHLDQPHERRDQERPGDRVHRVELADHVDRSRGEADLLLGLAERGIAGGRHRRRGSTLPPGKAISPRWSAIVSGRFVSTRRASPSRSKSGTSTADSRVSGWRGGPGSGGGRSAQRSRTSRNDRTRWSCGTSAHGAGFPALAPGGRGMRWSPPLGYFFFPPAILARTSRLESTSRSSPSTATSVPPYFE